ncbi:hypothetical protein ABZ646_13650, partial [Streptomyces sp. NPDC007162]
MSPAPLNVLLRRVDPDVPLPAYEHPGDAGADLRTTEACELAPGELQLDTKLDGIPASVLAAA